MPAAETTTADRSGHCLCGAVTYRVSGPIAMSAICHCSHCQRQTGSLFSMICAVPSGAFNASGEMSVFHDRGDSGQAVDRHFCPKCGSPIFSVVEAAPGLVFVKAGTLDDWQASPPTVEAYCGRSASWMPRFEGTATFAGPMGAE